MSVNKQWPPLLRSICHSRTMGGKSQSYEFPIAVEVFPNLYRTHNEFSVVKFLVDRYHLLSPIRTKPAQ